MSKSIISVLAILLLTQTFLTAEKSFTQEAEVALRKALAYYYSISTQGGYVGIYSTDLKQRYGEAFYEQAQATEIWVQPPGTPSIGECFLRAFRLTGDKKYLKAAKDAAFALVWGQRKIGGWDHRADIAHMQTDSNQPFRKNGPCTFDDNITQGALSFLMSMDEVIDEQWLSEAIELGLDYMMKSQLKNGAWPQWYPLRGGYHDYYTFNDNAINDCIKVMLKAHKIYGNKEYLLSARRGGDFIILSQFPAPQAGWAQQYSHDLKPAWARSFEPPGICSAATGRNIRTLVDLYLYTSDEKYLEPIPEAVVWLKKSRIDDNLWARLYEVGSNKPIYGDRTDGNKVHYDYDQISEKERHSYGWRGDYGIENAVEYYNQVKSLGVNRYLTNIKKPLTPAQSSQKAEQLKPMIEKIIAALDDQGRWIENNMIYSRVFVRNVNMICDYLTLAQESGTSSDCDNREFGQLPNIIIFLADDQGWGDLSLNGNRNVNTPKVDQLAREGASFSQFFVCPVCSPTRSEMLTGRYHPRSGVYSTSTGGERIDLDETTIAEVFKQAGYATAAFGKWHNGMQPPYHPNARGFDEFYGFCSGHWGNYFEPLLEHNGRLVKGKGYVSYDFTDKGLQFIEGHAEQPFFVYIAYNTPHSPMQVPEKWWEKFNANPLVDHHRDPEKEDLQHTRAALAMTENIDWNVGRVLTRIEQLGLTSNTIIVYFSDNGPNGWRWNGGLKGRKGSTDEGGVRSPLLVRWPGTIKAGLKIAQIAAAIDLLPTLAELAGIPFSTNKHLDGLSLKPLLLDCLTTEWSERYLFSHWRGRTSVRSQQYRLDNEGQLFNIIEDPGQYNDISERLPAVTNELLAAREAWVKEVTPTEANQDRPFTLGHPDYPYTQLPARDAIPHGGIKRSNRFPNDSFLTNWTSPEDMITWNVEVLADGVFDVTLYYTCPPSDVGSTFELRFRDSDLIGQITEGHNPPLMGMEHDRVKRIESYVKDFKPLNLGTIALKKGKGILSFKALDVPGAHVMDFKLLMFQRVGPTVKS